MSDLLPKLTYPESIFVLHTYVGLSCKLLACELLALRADQPELRPSQWITLDQENFIARLKALEAGHLTDGLGAPGLLAGDLFGWYLSELTNDSTLRDAIRGVMEALSELAWARVVNAGGIAVDLLREFYQAVVPRGLRRALGEFFTPRWLAERVLVKALEIWREGEGDAPSLSSARILDPTCGSGTFLVAAMRVGLATLTAEQRDEDPQALHELLERTIGFDINPVSVLMARVNMLLVLGDRAQHLAEFLPRVYEADSILLPELELGQMQIGGGGTSRRISTAVGHFFLPNALATLPGLKALRENLERGVERRRDLDTFKSRLAVDLKALGLEVDRMDEAIEGAAAIYRKVQDLASEDLNGVWGRIIEQATAPLFLDTVDLVVGNPPWVSWKNLPSGWKEASEELWRRWGLWQETRTGAGVPLSDISILLAARALDTYARGGCVALLLPLSVQIADPGGRKFRTCKLEPEGDAFNKVHFAPLFIDDFSAIRPFSPDAQNEPIALYMRAGEIASFPFPSMRWERRAPGSNLPSTAGWPEIKSLLVPDGRIIDRVHAEDPGSPWAPRADDDSLPLVAPDQETVYDWGRGFETRGLDGYFFYEILSDRPIGAERLVRIRNLPRMGKNTVGEAAREGLVEPRYLWPLIKGEQVCEWRVERKNLYCLVAHDLAAGGEIISLRKMMAECPRLFDFLEPWLDKFRARSLYRSNMEGDRPWGLSGPLHHLRSDTFAVLVRYIASGGLPHAAVAGPELDTRLGRSTLALPNNKSNIFFTGNLREAYYLAAWVNSRKARNAIGRFAASTGITPKALKNLPIPRFNDSDSRHLRLAELSQEAHALNQSALRHLQLMLDEIDSHVMQLGREHASSLFSQ